jgi:hypothetical protein
MRSEKIRVTFSKWLPQKKTSNIILNTTFDAHAGLNVCSCSQCTTRGLIVPAGRSGGAKKRNMRRVNNRQRNCDEANPLSLSGMSTTSHLDVQCEEAPKNQLRHATKNRFATSPNEVQTVYKAAKMHELQLLHRHMPGYPARKLARQPTQTVCDETTGPHTHPLGQGALSPATDSFIKWVSKTRCMISKCDAEMISDGPSSRANVTPTFVATLESVASPKSCISSCVMPSTPQIIVCSVRLLMPMRVEIHVARITSDANGLSAALTSISIVKYTV